MKKILLFSLYGMIFDHNYGARYQDAIGLKSELENNNFKVKISDDLSNENPEDYDFVFMIPKNANLFNLKPGIDKIKESQNEFINRLKSLDNKPKIFALFNDINIGLHNKYQDALFDGLKFNCIYAYDKGFNEKLDYQKELRRLRNTYIDKQYQKYINKEFSIDWIIISYLDHILELDKQESNQDIEPINNLYYGDYREGVIDSLLSMGIGSDLDDYVIGSQELLDRLGTAGIPIKIPMKKLKDYIKKARYNLIPYEKNKTNKQITARILEVLIFSHDPKKIKADHRWEIIQNIREERMSYNKMIEYLYRIKNKNLNKMIQLLQK